jgi:predicted alpha/beta superfamily hydrolase
MNMLRAILAVLLLADAYSTSPAQAPPSPSAAATPIVMGTSYKLPSALLGDVREINVWTPPGYENGTGRYDVLYLLDGALAQDFQHIAGLGQLGALSGTYKPLIVVGIETKRRISELTSTATDPSFVRRFPEGGRSDIFRNFLAKEVIPFVESRYRTGKRKALAGESLAGYFVLDTLLKQPDQFNDYVAVSPSLWWDRRALSNAAPSLLRDRPPAGKRLYLAVGNEGGMMQTGVNDVVAAVRRHAPASFDLHYADKSATETHSTIFHGAVHEALRWLYPEPPYDYGPTPWYMIEGAVPPPTMP